MNWTVRLDASCPFVGMLPKRIILDAVLTSLLSRNPIQPILLIINTPSLHEIAICLEVKRTGRWLRRYLSLSFFKKIVKNLPKHKTLSKTSIILSAI